MHKYQELLVWQKAMDYVVKVYVVTRKFPGEEKFGLAAQINRAAISIASNIAEGAGRDSKREFLHFLSIATGSSYEVETQLIISKKLGILEEQQLKELIECSQEIQKMITGLRKFLKNQL